MTTTVETPPESGEPAAPVSAEPRSQPSLRLVTVGMLTLVTLIAFEAMAVATAMPEVARAMDSVGAYGLAVSAFLATSLFGTVVSGYWNDRAGPLQPLLTGLGAFIAGLFISGFAPTFAVFVVGRVVAGVGAGLVTVSVYVLIGHAYPAARRPKVFAWFSAAWVLPSLIGPTLAGWLTDAISWRAIFVGVPPIAIPAALFLVPVLRRLNHDAADRGTAVRPWRRIIAGAGVALAATALQWGAERLGNGLGIVATVLGVLALAGTLAVLLPGGTARLRHGLPALIATRGLLTMSFFGANTFIPLMLVTHRGLSPTIAGIALTSGALGWSVGSWLQARTRTDLGRGRLLQFGAFVVGAGSVLLAVIVLGLPSWVILAVWAVAGIGMGAAMSSGSVLMLNLSEPSQQGTNSSYLQLADSLGGVLGVGVAGAIFAAAHAQGAVGSGIFAVIWLTLAVAGLGAGLAGRRTVRRG